MSVTFNRPRGLKYTDMAIYIDNNLQYIAEPNLYPEIESRIYEYIYHIVYALACKSGYFKNFADYDLFSCYAASELFLSMRKKQMNAGKEVRGKEVIPVKSSLNFIKATIFPLKVNYQRDTFATILDPKINEEVDLIETSARENIQRDYRNDLEESYIDALKCIPQFINEVIAETPFRSDPLVCKKLYLSIILTLLNDITVPNKLKNKLKKKLDGNLANKYKIKLSDAYTDNINSEIIWHIDEDISSYIRLLVRKVKKKFSCELNYYIHANDLSDELLDSIMANAYDTYNRPIGDEE